MKKLGELIKKLYYDRRIRFLFVGGLNTLVGYGTYALFIFLGLHYVLAQTLSTIIGVIHSYFWNKYFTFCQKKKSITEIIRFVFVYLVSFGLSLGIQYIMIDLNGINPYVSGLVSLIVTTLVSYFGHSLFSFKQKKQATATKIEDNIPDNDENIANDENKESSEDVLSGKKNGVG